MEKIVFALLFSISASVSALEICGEDLIVKQIGNYSTGSGGPYIGDLRIVAGAKGYEWRKRYGLDQELLDQTLSLALYAKASGREVDIYCTVSDQAYNARYIIVK